jgi:plastocyanin
MLLRKALPVVLLIVLAAAITSTAFGRQKAATPKLNATVGPGYTITLKQGGKVVKTLKAGTYKLVIADKANIHAFSLDGPHGFAKDFTKVPFVGTKTFALNLKAGSYKYYCPPHEAMMFGHFKVT